MSAKKTLICLAFALVGIGGTGVFACTGVFCCGVFSGRPRSDIVVQPKPQEKIKPAEKPEELPIDDAGKTPAQMYVQRVLRELSRGEKRESVVKPVPVSEIIMAFDQNPMAADRRYKGRFMLVAGTVFKVRPNFSKAGQTTIDLWDRSPELWMLRVNLRQLEAAHAGNLREKGAVRVAGDYAGYHEWGANDPLDSISHIFLNNAFIVNDELNDALSQALKLREKENE